MAFAVYDAKQTLDAYLRHFQLSHAKFRDKGGPNRERAANFHLDDIEVFFFSINSAQKGRYLATSGREGLHHIAFEVDDIWAAVEDLKARGAKLKPCDDCGQVEPHGYSDGWCVFLDEATVPGLRVELMQTYTREEREAREREQANEGRASQQGSGACRKGAKP